MKDFGGFKMAEIAPTVVSVNGVDLSAAARVMKFQYLTIKDA